MLGKYMPTQSSTIQKAQKTNISCAMKPMADSNAALPIATASLRVIEVLARLWELLLAVNSMEPAIMEHMKQAKMRPNGGSTDSPAPVRALTIAADQKKTKRYIIDSKSEDAVARARMRLSRDM